MRLPESLSRRLPVLGALRCGCWCCLYPASHHVLSVQSLQSCLTLCGPMDCWLPAFSVHGILQREYWSGFPCPSPGDHPDPGIEPTFLMSPAVAGRFLATSATQEVSDVQEQFITNWKRDIHNGAWERQERRSKLCYPIAHLIHHSYY